MDINGCNCLIVAGEKSGEEHCLSFYNELQLLCPNVHFWGVGGDDLKEAGMEIIYHLNEFSSWGFSGVISKIPFYLKALNEIEAAVIERGCKTAILIDFQGFNLKLAKKLNCLGVNVLYYVAPQAWAWKSGRTKIIANCVHTLFTILPFEKKWFQDRGVHQVKGVVHPLLYHYGADIEDIPLPRWSNSDTNLKLLLLPGSRNFEVEHLLPLYLQAYKKLEKVLNKKIELSVVCSPSVQKSLYQPLSTISKVHYYQSGQLSDALKTNQLAWAASGTVTLACALFQIPTIITYKTSGLNSFIYKTFIKYDGPVGLANIVHPKRVFDELLQENCTV
ncbi:MAG: lipid-A-disaccharide synthase [Desulforhopalus sp.]|jgi:lipid-A-disaccharide synthase